MKNRQYKIRELPVCNSINSRFRLLFNEFFEDLYIYAKSITKSEYLAKDAVSEVFLNLWATNSELIGINKIKPYLLVCTRNECIKLLYQADKSKGEDLADYVDRISPEEVLLEKELKEKLDQAIETLPDKCKLVFNLCIHGNKTHKEVAKELGVSVSTVNSQLSNAFKVIRIEISKLYDISSFESYSNSNLLSLLPTLILLGNI